MSNYDDLQLSNAKETDSLLDTPKKSLPSIMRPGKRSRINLVAILANWLLPWLLFCSCFALHSFYFGLGRTFTVSMVTLFGLFVSIVLLYQGHCLRLQTCREPFWYNYAGVACLIATIVGSLLGSVNFWYNIQPFETLAGLKNVVSLDPARDDGQETMDIGIAQFADGSGIDQTMAMSFKSDDLYCVAPIVNAGKPSQTYDFWAVGMNCCSETAPEFHCGQVSTPQARSGLREMNMGARPYYRLAVQQAEAAYKITAPHPTFFKWVADPDYEKDQYHSRGERHFIEGVLVFLLFSAFCVTVATMLFSRIGFLEEVVATSTHYAS